MYGVYFVVEAIDLVATLKSRPELATAEAAAVLIGGAAAGGAAGLGGLHVAKAAKLACRAGFQHTKIISISLFAPPPPFILPE